MFVSAEWVMLMLQQSLLDEIKAYSTVFFQLLLSTDCFCFVRTDETLYSIIVMV